MAFILETGSGTDGANSLASLEYANGYNSTTFESESWSDLEVETRQAALIAATALVCDAVDWPGRRLRPMQPLPFPRAGLRDAEGFVHPTWPPPRDVLDAVCEMARVLALRHEAGQGGSTSTSSDQAVQEITVGPIGLVMASPSTGTAVVTEAAALIPPAVMLRLRRFGAQRSGYGPRMVVRWD